MMGGADGQLKVRNHCSSQGGFRVLACGFMVQDQVVMTGADVQLKVRHHCSSQGRPV